MILHREKVLYRKFVYKIIDMCVEAIEGTGQMDSLHKEYIFEAICEGNSPQYQYHRITKLFADSKKILNDNSPMEFYTLWYGAIVSAKDALESYLRISFGGFKRFVTCKTVQELLWGLTMSRVIMAATDGAELGLLVSLWFLSSYCTTMFSVGIDIIVDFVGELSEDSAVYRGIQNIYNHKGIVEIE